MRDDHAKKVAIANARMERRTVLGTHVYELSNRLEAVRLLSADSYDRADRDHENKITLNLVTNITKSLEKYCGKDIAACFNTIRIEPLPPEDDDEFLVHRWQVVSLREHVHRIEVFLEALRRIIDKQSDEP